MKARRNEGSYFEASPEAQTCAPLMGAQVPEELQGKTTPTADRDTYLHLRDKTLSAQTLRFRC